MLKLMKMELKKFPISGYIRGALIAMTVILIFMVLLFWTSVLEGERIVYTQLECVDMVSVLVNDVFLIFAAVMFSNYVIGEYSSGTINILFTYPISRRKIIWSKILLVCSFMIMTMILANLFVLTSMYLINSHTATLPVVLDGAFILAALTKIIMNSVAFSLIGTLCLYFGMRKKSKVAAIVASIIIVAVVGSSTNGFSLSSIVFVPLTLALVGVTLTIFTFRRIEEIDVK